MHLHSALGPSLIAASGGFLLGDVALLCVFIALKKQRHQRQMQALLRQLAPEEGLNTNYSDGEPDTEKSLLETYREEMKQNGYIDTSDDPYFDISKVTKTLANESIPPKPLLFKLSTKEPLPAYMIVYYLHSQYSCIKMGPLVKKEAESFIEALSKEVDPYPSASFSASIDTPSLLKEATSKEKESDYAVVFENNNQLYKNSFTSLGQAQEFYAYLVIDHSLPVHIKHLISNAVPVEFSERKFVVADLWQELIRRED